MSLHVYLEYPQAGAFRIQEVEKTVASCTSVHKADPKSSPSANPEWGFWDILGYFGIRLCLVRTITL